MTLAPGARIATFEILRALGAGGMGEVYEARDPRLGRRVAIKVLPAVFASEPDRLARFEREARAVAALSHPNILAIHDFGRDGSVVYAVMELLEGVSLRETLAAGALPPRKAIEYAVQIAQGLASAHDSGRAHRDLKPDNLFITRDDRVKILDFGLAKALDTAPASATMANTGGTAAGTVLGTMGYMAPEQVRGLATDHRADLFAFGAVLYEMLAGRRAFHGETAADTISAILNADPPDLDVATGRVPPALDRIVRRCLEKKPELRFQSARDLAFALDTLTSTTRVSATGTVTPGRARAPTTAVAAAALVVVAALTLAVWAFLRRAPPAPRFEQFLQVTDAAGEEGAPSLSPDGQHVAYATRARGTWDVYAQRVGGRNATPVAADPERDEASPAFSPDGGLIAFHEGDDDGGIFIVGATGEAARRITDFGFHPAWSPDGRRLAFTTEAIVLAASRLAASALWVADVAGGAPRRIDGTGDAAQASWSPSGERLAYWSNTGGQRDIYTIPVSGGQRTSVTEDGAIDWGPIWTPEGRSLIFASDRGGSMNLWRIAVDQSSGRASGTPEPVTAGVQAALEQPSLSRDGRRLAFRSRMSAINPVALPLDVGAAVAGPAVILNTSNAMLVPTDLSPDGASVAYYNLGERQEDIFVSAADGSGLRRIIDDAARDRGPVWTRDGRSLLFFSNRDGRWAIWRIGRDGGNLQKVGGVPDNDLTVPLLSPGGDRLIASGFGGMFIMDLTERSAAFRPLETARVADGTIVGTSWSRDGTKVVGPIGNPNGRPVGIGVYDLVTRAARKVSVEATYSPVWLSDSRRIVYFTSGGELVLLDTVSMDRRVVKAQIPLPPADELLAISKDDRVVLYGGTRSESDIWVADQQRAR
ncbi:MAG: serine/threonine-protein kinase [Acidobacteria bacterium]|nr:serine/threonine-protein kinase [Acidobacteriota bacterium]